MFHLQLCFLICSILLLNSSPWGLLSVPHEWQLNPLPLPAQGSLLTHPSLQKHCLCNEIFPTILLKILPHTHMLFNLFPDTFFFLTCITKTNLISLSLYISIHLPFIVCLIFFLQQQSKHHEGRISVGFVHCCISSST